MFNNSCSWTVYDDDSRGILGIALYVAGFCSVVLNGWLLVAFLKTALLNYRSYLTLLNLCVASMARSLVAGFVFTGVSAVAHRWWFGETSCKLFGFLNQFIGVYQIEALTHMCIERYVAAKYFKHGWEVSGSRYALFAGLCWMFSTLYSVPALFGLGSYSWDYTCAACTYSLVLPAESFQKFVVVSVLILESVKPVLVMSAMLRWAHQVETKWYNPKEHQSQLALTKSVGLVTCAVLACWAPTGLAVGFVASSQLLQGTLAQPPLLLAMLASIGSEIMPAITVAAVVWSDERVRSVMLSMLGEAVHNKNS